MTCRGSANQLQTKLGFSLIELTMAIGLFSFSLVAILGLLASGLTQSRMNVERAASAQIVAWAESRLEEAEANGQLSTLGSLEGHFDADGLERDATDPDAIYTVKISPAAQSNLPGTSRALSAFIIQIAASARNDTSTSSHVLWLDS